MILTRNSYLLLFSLYHDQDALYVLLWNDQIIRFKASELLDESKTDKDLNQVITVRYHSGGSMKLNASILLLAHMVYL